MRLYRVVLILLAAGWSALAAGPAVAQEGESWRPPPPDENAWDWIRLNSGEWLGGTIEGLRDRNLEFDSDELGLQKLDWTDVAELRSPRTLTYRFDNLIRAAVVQPPDVVVQLRDLRQAL